MVLFTQSNVSCITVHDWNAGTYYRNGYYTHFPCLPESPPSLPEHVSRAAKWPSSSRSAAVASDVAGRSAFNALTAYFGRCFEAGVRIGTLNITIAPSEAWIQLKPLHKLFAAILINWGKHGERSHNAKRNENDHQDKRPQRFGSLLQVSQFMSRVSNI